jgi:hypothetical protein
MVHPHKKTLRFENQEGFSTTEFRDSFFLVSLFNSGGPVR